MKGIILAGGRGMRLYPITAAANKHLLPVYDKPLIYYPISTLMLASIRDILIISKPEDQSALRSLLRDGSEWGMRFSFAVQDHPRGIAEAFLIAGSFFSGEHIALALGDNIFFGHGLKQILDEASVEQQVATIFGYWMPNPEEFGVVEFGPDGQVLSIEEKPTEPRSNYVVVGLYFYDSRVFDFAAELQPSGRGELEITDINRRYLEAGDLKVRRLERGFAWLDAGNPDALLDAANYIATIERRQGLKIACVEEIAWRQGWIGDDDLVRLSERMPSGSYSRYLKALLEYGG